MPGQFASRQNYSGSSSGFPFHFRPCASARHALIGVVAKGHLSLESVRNSSPNDSVVHQDDKIRACIYPANSQSVHDMCGRECLLNILKMEILIPVLKLPHRLTDNLR
jgi:hypothetical protein